jgi:hypothetical protein
MLGICGANNVAIQTAQTVGIAGWTIHEDARVGGVLSGDSEIVARACLGNKQAKDGEKDGYKHVRSKNGVQNWF